MIPTHTPQLRAALSPPKSPSPLGDPQNKDHHTDWQHHRGDFSPAWRCLLPSLVLAVWGAGTLAKIAPAPRPPAVVAVALRRPNLPESRGLAPGPGCRLRRQLQLLVQLPGHF